MHDSSTETRPGAKRVLVLGGTGKTGRRVAAGLEAKGLSVRIGSRGATPPFHWNDESGWDACLQDMDAAYVSYAPDLAMPGATDAIQAFVDRAESHGLKQLVLLSGRGEPEAQACERIVRDSGMAWTVVRSSWFFQNFSEGAFTEMVLGGRITLPAGDVPEPFVDVDDIAEVAVAALSEPGHTGRVYEVTGPRAVTFGQLAAELSDVLGRNVAYVEVPHDAFIAEIRRSGAPKEVSWMLDYLFSTVLDGRNAGTVDGVEQALGRPARDLRDWAREAATAGAWREAT